MEPRDIEFILKIKNFKVGKFLHLYAEDALMDFQKRHPRIIPSLLHSLKIGDPRESLRFATQMEESLESLLGSIQNLKDAVNTYMVSELPEKEEGKGDQFITPEGGIGVSFIQGEESVKIDQEEEKPKKKPRKKRATKKKTTKKEE